MDDTQRRRSAGAGEGSLSGALLDAVEGGDGHPRRRPEMGGSRLFVESLQERDDPRRPSGLRPRLGAMLLAAMVCLVVTAGVALWPGIVAQVRAGGARSSPQRPPAAVPARTNGPAAPPAAGPRAG